MNIFAIPNRETLNSMIESLVMALNCFAFGTRAVHRHLSEAREAYDIIVSRPSDEAFQLDLNTLVTYLDDAIEQNSRGVNKDREKIELDIRITLQMVRRVADKAAELDEFND